MEGQFPDFGGAADASQARYKAEMLERENKELREAVDRLCMVTRAVWEFVADSHSLHLYDLLKKVNEIDLRDGRKDGRSNNKVFKCKSCGRTLNRRKRTCIYCGSQNATYDPFQIL